MKYLIIPGLNGSGPDHWQTKWHEIDPFGFERVEQENWELPDMITWTGKLESHIKSLNEPVFLVAHSLGCITAVHWAAANHTVNIAGALLVAPADVESSTKPGFKTFAPVPLKRLPFRTAVVASENDQYASIARLSQWAGYWDAEFINVGRRGHINSLSGLGDWEEGLNILENLVGHPVGKIARTA